MTRQDNSAKNIGNIVEPKEGERALLSCNTADVRSPSLGITPISLFESEDIALDYLAGLLVQAYFDMKDNERKQYNWTTAGGDLLQGFDKRAGH